MQQVLLKHLVPVGELRSNMAHRLDQLKSTGRPVVITQNGKAAAVLVTPELLDEIEERSAVVRLVMQGLRDVAAGQLVDDDQVWAEVDDVIAKAEERVGADPVD